MYFCLFCGVLSLDSTFVIICCCYENFGWNPEILLHLSLKLQLAMWEGVSLISFATFPLPSAISVEDEEVDDYLSLKYDMLIAEFLVQLPETKCMESLFLS